MLDHQLTLYDAALQNEIFDLKISSSQAVLDGVPLMGLQVLRTASCRAEGAP